MKPLVVAASASTTAPKVQVVAHLVCRALRPEYKDRSGADQPSIFLSPNGEETRLCDADPAVQAASAEFLTRKCLTRTPLEQLIKVTPPFVSLIDRRHSSWKVITTATGVLSCITTAYWASVSLRVIYSISTVVSNVGVTVVLPGFSARTARVVSVP